MMRGVERRARRASRTGAERRARRAGTATPEDEDAPLERRRPPSRRLAARPGLAAPRPRRLPGDEPPRRLDRLDLLLLIGLVLFAFLFRLWRLDLPRHTHFDEVYHARSATEWLADWQEGWTRDTYEWTHPPLAKYLIAAGIVVADPNQVVGGIDLDAPATAMAVAPQRTALRPARLGRLHLRRRRDDRRRVTRVSGDGGLELAGSRATWPAWPTTRTVTACWSASPATGRWPPTTWPPSSASIGERGPPPGVAQIETGLAGGDQIVVPNGQAVILFRGPDGIVEVERATGVELASSDLRGRRDRLPARPGRRRRCHLRPGWSPSTSSAALLVVLDGATLAAGDRCRPATDGRDPAGAADRPARSWSRGAARTPRSGSRSARSPLTTSMARVLGGLSVFDESVQLIDTVPLPGPAVAIGWQQVANIVYVAGIDAASGRAGGVDRQPARQRRHAERRLRRLRHHRPPRRGRWRMAFDISRRGAGRRPCAPARLGRRRRPRRGSCLIDAGSNAFAWRLAGIVFGSILVGLIYLLRRDALLAPADRGAGGGLRGRRRDELRHEPDLHERHLRGDLHRGRLRALLADLVRPMGAQRLVGAARWSAS